MCFTGTTTRAAGFHIPSRGTTRITRLTSSTRHGRPTIPWSSHTRKGASLLQLPLYFAHDSMLIFRLLIDYRWFDAVRRRFSVVHVAAGANLSRLETNYTKIRVWLRVELHHLRVLEPEDRKARIRGRIPRRGRLGIWRDTLHECHRCLEGNLAPPPSILHHF